MLVPSEISEITAVPDLTPSLDVFSVTDRPPTLLTLAASPVNDPAAEIAPVAEPMLASSASENPSSGAVLVKVNPRETASSTWLLPTSMGGCATGDATARLNTVPVAVTVCVPIAVVPRPSMPVPSEISEITADPDWAPAAPVFSVTARLPLLVACAPSAVNDP